MNFNEKEENELNKLVKRKNQEKWFELFMILCELEKNYTIQSFNYTGHILEVKVGDTSFLRIFLV